MKKASISSFNFNSPYSYKFNLNMQSLEYTKLKGIKTKTRCNIICYIITVFDWKTTRTNSYVQHLHVIDEDVDTKTKLAIFLKTRVDFGFKPGDIIMVIDSYINHENIILNKNDQSIKIVANIWSNKVEIEDLLVNERVSAIVNYFHDIKSSSVPDMHIKECLLNGSINYVGVLMHIERELPNLNLLYFSDNDNNRFVVKAWDRYAIRGNELKIGQTYLLYAVKILQVENMFVGCFHESGNGYIMHVEEKYNWKLGIKNNCNCIKTEMRFSNVDKDVSGIVDINDFNELEKAIFGVYLVSMTVVEFYGFPLHVFYKKVFCECRNLSEIENCLKCKNMIIDHYKIISVDARKNKMIFLTKAFNNVKKADKLIALVAKDDVNEQVIYTIVKVVDLM